MAYNNVIPWFCLVHHLPTGRTDEDGRQETYCGRFMGKIAFDKNDTPLECGECREKKECDTSS